MTRAKFWTAEEDSILRSRVMAYPKSKKRAFEETAKDLGRTYKSCRQRWYNHVSRRPATAVIASCWVVGKPHRTSKGLSPLKRLARRLGIKLNLV